MDEQAKNARYGVSFFNCLVWGYHSGCND